MLKYVEKGIEWLFIYPMYIVSTPAVVMILIFDQVYPWHKNFIEEYKVVGGLIE